MTTAAQFPRARLTLLALLTLAAAGIALSLVVAWPFIPGLTWALAFAVVGHPIHEWMQRRINHRGIAAGLAVALVVVTILGPMLFVGWHIGRQLTEGVNAISSRIESAELQQHIQRYPLLASGYRWLTANVDVAEQLRNVTARLQETAGRWLRNIVSGAVQSFIAMFALFFFFRDRKQVLEFIRSLLPLSRPEADHLLEQIRRMTHATIYGTVVVAAVQGALGGLVFWFLGIHGALLWGVAMGVLAIVPVLGAFVIWLPAAVVLALQGGWGKAIVLTAWGTLVVGLIDNLLYPMLVGKEMRLHTLPVFIAIVGGVVMFGAAGVVLGPVILAGTIAILDILRQRTAGGRSAEAKTG
jgi:predicted PurR-regulated permease PerM